MIYLNPISYIGSVLCSFHFHWYLSPMIQLTVIQYWSRYHGAEQGNIHYLNKCLRPHTCVTQHRWISVRHTIYATHHEFAKCNVSSVEFARVFNHNNDRTRRWYQWGIYPSNPPTAPYQEVCTINHEEFWVNYFKINQLPPTNRCLRQSAKWIDLDITAFDQFLSKSG